MRHETVVMYDAGDGTPHWCAYGPAVIAECDSWIERTEPHKATGQFYVAVRDIR